MLHEFLTEHQVELARRCREKVVKRALPKPTPNELEFGVPLFIRQLIATLRAEAAPGASTDLPKDIGTTAGKHGNELLLQGFTIDQVVHDYGDLCQALTELAHERKAPITVEEFHTFNRCLDNAMADAVTEYGRQRDQLISEEGTRTMNERLGALAHELRNLLNTATLAYHAIKTGSVALTGATGKVLERSLHGLRDLVDRSLADVRLTAGLQANRVPIAIDQLVEEVLITASMDATDRGLELTASSDPDLGVEADRQMVVSAITNLLDNAFKFTRPKTAVRLTARAVADRVVIEVADACGGLIAEPEALFKPFQQSNGDRSGVGLGLSISRRAIEANGGRLFATTIAGVGCVFTIDLPRAPKP